MAINGVVKTGNGPVYVSQNGLQNANIRAVFVASTVLGGQLAATLGNVTASATATLLNTGALAKTLEDVTLVATGSLPGVGELSKTLDDVTLAAAGTLAIAGTSSATLDALTVSATATLLIQGAEAKTLDDLTSAGTATLLITGQGAVTLDDLTVSATGVDIITGQGDVTLAPLTGSAAATLTAGVGDTLAQLVERAKGAGGVSPRRRRRKRDPIAIAARLWIRLPRLQAVVEFSEPPVEPLAPEGELRGRLALPKVCASGVVGAIGRAVLPLALPSIEARVFIAPCGDARFLLCRPVMRAHVRARHDHFTDKQIERAVSLLLVA